MPSAAAWAWAWTPPDGAPHYGRMPSDSRPRGDTAASEVSTASEVEHALVLALERVAERAAGRATERTASYERAAQVAAARGLIVVLNRTHELIPAWVRQLAE